MIDVKLDDREVQAALRQLARAAADMTPAMRSIAAELADSVERAFEREADPATGVPWAPLAISTQKSKVRRSGTRTQRERGAHPILQVTGELASSITPDHGRTWAAAGTNKPYAAIHHFGGQAGRRRATTIPARPYLGLDVEGVSTVLGILQRHLERALRRR